MKRIARLLGATALVALVGCGTATTSYVKSHDTTLGRVVVYRNGIAYFERYAHVEGDTLKICVDLSGKERPTEFKTKPGSGFVLSVFKRAD